MSAAGDYSAAPLADFVLPFELPGLELRGRLTRLDAVSTRALQSHPLPEPVQRVLAEALGVTALLGSVLRKEGRLSVQTRGDGPLDLLATDYFAGGGMRGYARLDEKAFAGAGEPKDFAALLGKGHFAITIEQKEGALPYQGLVELSPDGIAASARTYFEQSEQLPTLLKLVAGPVYSAESGHGWRAGGLMVQFVPKEGGGSIDGNDDWQRVAMFLETLGDYELLDTALPAEELLWRLFHEDEVRVHPSQALHFHCGCQRERIEAVLMAYAPEELKPLADPDGIIRARCEFCGAVYEFPLSAFIKT